MDYSSATHHKVMEVLPLGSYPRDLSTEATEGNAISPVLAPFMPRPSRLGDYRCNLASTGASQVADWCVRLMVLGDPSGDLQLVTLVALIALARTFGVNLRTLPKVLLVGLTVRRARDAKLATSHTTIIHRIYSTCHLRLLGSRTSLQYVV